MSDKDYEERDFSLQPEAVLGSLLQVAVVGAVILTTSPIWVPIAIYNRVRKSLEPKPAHRGTVRPSGMNK